MMPDRSSTVDVLTPIQADVAPALLTDARARAAMGRLISRVLHPRPVPSELAQAIAEAKAEAQAAGLTDADVVAELDAYNAERRNPPPA